MATPAGAVIPRAVAFIVGGFALVNAAGGWLRPGFDANNWWIDLRPLPSFAASWFLFVASGFLLAHSFSPARRATVRARVTLSLLVVLAAFALWNCAHFFILQAQGSIAAGIPLPFSAFVFAALVWVGWSVGRCDSVDLRSPARRASAFAVVVGLLTILPLCQMWCFGKTDYRRPADAAVVFGAGVDASGRPSDALKDRVRTACALYHEGLVRQLIFSGGPGAGKVHETEAMRRFATTLPNHAVPYDAILLDPDGVNTRATVENTCRLFRQHNIARILAVSHFYHLPRIKLAYQRAGRNVYTVPAEESYTLTMLPWYVAREVAAVWAYFVAPGAVPRLANA